MSVALIVAAGSGERLRAGVPKALVALAGRPLLQWSIDALAAVAGVREIVVALPPGTPAPPGVTGVVGGAVRSESVKRALAACAQGDPVLVHDAARPLLTAALAERVIAALAGDPEADGAIAAAPVTDTIKRVDAATRAVGETLERGELWAVQTPQVFRRAALERALDVDADVLAQATDDAWLIERAGGKVIVVPAGEPNVKVTTALDLALAELLLSGRGPQDAGPAAGAGNPA
jgi:2-C-methyl-D-erythritol 4-phosphate cytidylyltransferase